MTPNALARTMIGIAGILFACGGILEAARIPLLLDSGAERAWAPYVHNEARVSVLYGALSVAIGAALFRSRREIAERIDPATEGNGAASPHVQALAYALIGVYYLIPAAATIFLYLVVESSGASGEWKAWAPSIAQAGLSLALVLGARRLARWRA